MEYVLRGFEKSSDETHFTYTYTSEHVAKAEFALAVSKDYFHVNLIERNGSDDIIIKQHNKWSVEAKMGFKCDNMDKL